MKRHQRCLATLACQAVDRAPLYLPAIACSAASEILGRPVHTGTGSLHFAEVAAWADGEQAHAEFEDRFFEDLAAIHRALDADVLRLPWRMNWAPTRRLDEHTFIFGDEAGEYTVWKYEPDTADFSAIYASPRKEAPEDRLRREVESAEAASDQRSAWARRAIAPTVDLWRRFGGEFFVIGTAVGISVGLDPDDLMLLASEPELMARRMILQAEQAIAVGRALVEAGCPAVILGGGDLAGNTGPMYSPAMFRRIVLPAYIHALDHLNRIGVHYAFRSDGDLWSLTDMLFGEAACPGYGETDRDAGMTVAALRRRYPNLVIWGNVSSSLLDRGTPEQVRRQAREILEESQGRGYFQGCSNAIIHGTARANVEALVTTR